MGSGALRWIENLTTEGTIKGLKKSEAKMKHKDLAADRVKKSKQNHYITLTQKEILTFMFQMLYPH